MSYCDKKITIYVVILDLSKAFDTIQYDKVPLKLTHYDINRDTHSWINNVLTARYRMTIYWWLLTL